MCLVESREGFFEPISPAAVQVDDRLDSRSVHLVEVPHDSLRRERCLAAAQVIVNVDDRKGGLGDLGRLGDQHGPRVPVAQFRTA